MIEIKLFKDNLNLNGYTLIEAFPGAGLVGPMTASYVIEKLGMQYVGYVDSDLFPPIASVHAGMPMYPARIYKDDKFKILIVMSEFVIPQNSIYQLAREILSFVRKYKLAKIISISGMPSQKPSDNIYITSYDPETVKKAAKSGIKPITEGVVAGVSAILLINSEELKIPSMNLLVEVNPTVMNPLYAETAIKGLSKLISLDIDLKELEKEAKIVESKMRDILKKTKESPDFNSNAAEATGPSMYA